MQIAVRDADNKEEVFVLDLLTMPPKMYNSTLSDVFLSKSILKLGQGFYQDLKELAQSYPKASCFRVAKSVVEVNDLSISLVGSHHPLSLQKLVFLYLHRKLTKTQQTSNWNRRPLAPSQLHYAAADALVLIHLYDELMKLMAAKRDDFQLESVMNVLDVHVAPAPKCNLCFECFDSVKMLKAHRKICAQDVRTLDIC
uniref:3'-5' exonuclease domain-containing protein n=1 Tax=Globisporangium ultimum (strain ATCC 200006 / CBS 805.95 / DAOM BR144) TaxID=431595 RepID=K3X8W4_GLOUD